MLLVLITALAVCVPGRAAPPRISTEAGAEFARLRAEAGRRSLLAFDREDLLPKLENAASSERPGWTYRNPLTAGLALATGSVEALYQSGLEKLAEGTLEESAYYLARVRSAHPEHRRARDAAFWLGEVRRRQGKGDEAIAFFRLVSGDFTREAQYRLARLLDRGGRPEEARAAWKRIADDRANPHCAEAHLRLGWEELERANPHAASSLFERATRAADASASGPSLRTAALFGQAIARRELGELRPAESGLVRILLEWPDHPVAPAAALVLGSTLAARGKAREAEGRFLWVLSVAPSSRLAPPAKYGEIRALADRGEFDAAAEAARGFSPEPDPFWQSSAWLAVAWARWERGEAGDALPFFEEALAARSDATAPLAAYMAGECLRRLGRLPEATRRFEEVPQSSPLRPGALARAGAGALEGGRPAEALRLFRAAAQGFPEYPETDRLNVGIGEAHLALGQLEEAWHAFQAVPEESAWHADALRGRASTALRQGRWGEAADLLGRVLAALPQGPERDRARLSLARVRVQQRSPAAALEALAALDLAKAPRDVALDARALQGFLWARTGDSRRAREALERLLAEGAAGSAAAQAHEGLAELELASGRPDSALAHLEQMVLSAAGPGEARRARALRADLLLGLRRYSEALPAYRELEGADPAHGAILCLAALGALAELERAVPAFVARYPSDPRTAEVFSLLGGARLEARRPDEAALAYGRAAELARGESEANDARLRRARAFLTAGREAEAVPELDRVAAAAGPAAVEALRELAALRERGASHALAREAWGRLAERLSGDEKCLALRTAARHAGADADPSGTTEILRRALEACPGAEVGLRQGLLADLGEALLVAGRRDEAAAPLEKAAQAGLGPEGLRALGLLARVREESGRVDEALETYLRMGYLYPPTEEASARALLRAAEILHGRGEETRAHGLYGRVRREAAPELAAEAARRLAEAVPAAEPGASEKSAP